MITAGEAATLAYQHRRIPARHADDLATELYLLRFDHSIRKSICEGRCSAQVLISSVEHNLPTYDRTRVMNKVISKLEGSGYQIDTPDTVYCTITARWSRLDDTEGEPSTLVELF
jgi:hypothetical protein